MKSSMKRILSIVTAIALTAGTMTAALAKTVSEATDAPADTALVFTVKLGAIGTSYTWADISGRGSFTAATNTYGAKDSDGNLTTVDYTGIPLSDLLSAAAKGAGLTLSDSCMLTAVTTDGYTVAFTVGDVRDSANHYLVVPEAVKNYDGETVYDNSYVRIVRGDAQTTPNKVSIRCVTGIEAPEADKTPAAGAVVASKQSLKFNGAAISLEAYNIDGYNYFKLRDIASLLDGTASQFSLTVDGANFAISAAKGQAYTAVGGEKTVGEDKSATCVASTWKLTVDGVRCYAYVYNLGGNNFFKLSDLGTALGFGVAYDAATNTVSITSAGYAAE